jgi:hypothetical protein
MRDRAKASILDNCKTRCAKSCSFGRNCTRRVTGAQIAELHSLLWNTNFHKTSIESEESGDESAKVRSSEKHIRDEDDDYDSDSDPNIFFAKYGFCPPQKPDDIIDEDNDFASTSTRNVILTTVLSEAWKEREQKFRFFVGKAQSMFEVCEVGYCRLIGLTTSTKSDSIPGMWKRIKGMINGKRKISENANSFPVEGKAAPKFSHALSFICWYASEYGDTIPSESGIILIKFRIDMDLFCRFISLIVLKYFKVKFEFMNEIENKASLLKNTEEIILKIN